MTSIKTEHYEIIIVGDLARLRFYGGKIIDIPQAKAYSNFIEEHTKDTPFASISFAESGANWTRDARKYLGSRTPNQYAAAMVSDSPVLKIIANFFIKLNKPQYPTKFFNTIPEAEAWVEEMKAKFYQESTSTKLA